MKWKLDTERPIYLQIVEHIEKDIMKGKYPPHSQLPSVRALALEIGVNPNTVQRAMAELERKGLVVSQRTNGRFITDDQERIQQMKREFAQEEIQMFLSHMHDLGLDTKAVIEAIQKVEGKKDE